MHGCFHRTPIRRGVVYVTEQTAKAVAHPVVVTLTKKPLAGGVGYDQESPPLQVLPAGCAGPRGKYFLDDGIRHGIGFKATHGT